MSSSQMITQKIEHLASTLRPITDDDLEFLFQLYASTRAGEKELVGWEDEPWEVFLRMQFNLQHGQYMQNYEQPTFDIVMLGTTPVGRLYVNRGANEIRIVDITLSPEYRGRGLGAKLVHAAVDAAAGQGIDELFLFTPDHASFYGRLGWSRMLRTTLQGTPVDLMRIHPPSSAARAVA